MEKVTDKNNVIDLRKRVKAAVEREKEKYEELYKDPNTFSSPDILTALNANEDGDAWLFINLFKNRFCYDHADKKWFRWTGNYWKEDRIEEVLASVDAVVECYSEEKNRQSAARINAAKIQDETSARKAEGLEKELVRRISNLQSVHRKKNVLILAAAGDNSLGITGDEWDLDPMLLGCENGVIELETGAFKDGQPKDYIKSVAPTIWVDIESPAPTWEKFLTEIFDGNKDLINYMQRLLGYSVSGLTKAHLMTILFGVGRNGKGTILETLKAVLGGDLAGSIRSEMLLSQTHLRSSAGPSPDIMALRGRRIAWASETDDGRKIDIGKMKWLVGGDTLVGRNVFGKREIQFTPTHSIFLLTNHKPRIPAEEYAAWQRIHLIPFTLSFVEEPNKDNEKKHDLDLKEKLLNESSGILAWLVKGFLLWQKEGLNPPKIVKEATKEYQEEEDIIGHFIKERCELISGKKVQANSLYESYKTWCEFNGHNPLTGTSFGKRMGDRFEKSYDGRFHYKGITLITDLISP